MTAISNAAAGGGTFAPKTAIAIVDIAFSAIFSVPEMSGIATNLFPCERQQHHNDSDSYHSSDRGGGNAITLQY